ncbi:MAG: hypothetical protein O7G88_22530 [bacterium]|nr:hypothetical protein [bacterium]
MASPKKSSSWQDMRRALSSKNKTALLNLIRDLYALSPENQELVQTQALVPKTSPSRTVTVKDIRRGTTFEVVLKGKTSKAAPRSKTSQVAPKIRRLAQVAAELREGDFFKITRLTTLKSLCKDAEATAQFALYLAKQTYRKMREQDCPSHLDPEKWEYFNQVVDEAIRQMERYMDNPTEDEVDMVRAWRSDVQALQDQYERQAWGPVRIIDSTEVLIVEQALSCLLQPTASAEWGYRIARQYAECYDPRYGTGLIPESAPLVEDIADFWCQYHLGKSLQEWLGTS